MLISFFFLFPLFSLFHADFRFCKYVVFSFNTTFTCYLYGKREFSFCFGFISTAFLFSFLLLLGENVNYNYLCITLVFDVEIDGCLDKHMNERLERKMKLQEITYV